MLFPKSIIQEISSCAHWADRLIRGELIEGVIVSENDYTSNLTGALRREINARIIPGLKATIQVLNPSAERELGADACVIFQNDTHFKASIFEAKWPRLSTHINTWDSKQKSTGESHFHSQLRRQHVQSHYAAAWEIFYCEFPFGAQPKYIPNEGSACVWHKHAFMASMARPQCNNPWSDDDLKSLLETNAIDIATIFTEICSCNQGKPLPHGRYDLAFGDAGAPHEALIISYSPEKY